MNPQNLNKTFVVPIVLMPSLMLLVLSTIAVSWTSAQTTQAPQIACVSVYVDYNWCCPAPGGGADEDDHVTTTCNLFCGPPSYQFVNIVTPFGQSDGSNDTDPTWSADATKIAFVRSNDILIADATGTNALAITHTANNWSPAWSPDGARIAFASARDTSYGEIYLMNPDGSNVVRLTYLGSSVGHPAWSPDGRRLAFNCVVDGGNSDICAINPDGTGFVRLTTDPAWDSGPTWSPDGASIAFATTRYEGGPKVAVMNADGSGVS